MSSLVVIDLAIDSGGVNTEVAEAVARRYEGRWLQTSARDSSRRVRLTIRYDAAHHQLVATDDSDDWPPSHGGGRWGYVLVPRAEGIFALGYGINDELAQMPAEPAMLRMATRVPRTPIRLDENSTTVVGPWPPPRFSIQPATVCSVVRVRVAVSIALSRSL